MKIKTLAFTLGIMLIALLPACNKKKWKKTAVTRVELLPMDNKVYWGVNVLTIDTTIIQVSSMTLDGHRIQADDIHLSQNLSSSATLTSSKIHLGSFDVPQGTYEALNLAVQFGGSGTPVVVKGNYENAGGIKKNVLLYLDFNELILRQVLENNSTTVLVEEGKTKEIHLELDPEVVFDNVNPSMWNSASSNGNGNGGNPTINVSNSENTNMYNAVMAKIGEAISYKIN